MTVDELLANLPHFGLPHFQRGRVWDDTAVSMLMESLIDDTPCGSIILWRPRGKSLAHGERPIDWGQAAGDSPRFLVVDGQQRLTALNALWNGDWAVNLTAFPELQPPQRLRIQSRNPFVPWPHEPGPSAGPTTRDNYRLRTKNLVRLAAILGEKAPPVVETPIEQEAWTDLVHRIRRARQRRFHMLVKRATPLGDVVNLYNRINSSGVPVRKEERAFAAMVAIDPLASEWLRECFNAAHPQHKDPDRDAVLKRQRERMFGFPLFIAAYAQTVGFHRDLKGDLDLLARDNPDLSWVGEQSIRKAMRTDSLDCIKRTGDVLRDVLLCDDLRFLPSAEPLRLTFALQLKYPQVDDQTLAKAVLLGQVNRITGHIKPVRIERALLDSNSLSEAIESFPSVPAMLGDAASLERRLRRVDSMNDPWVSLMYWYQRSLGSQDYLLVPPRTALIPLDREADASKEHIVPFSWLYRQYGLDPRGHSSRHIVNSIGNLTMISGAFNYDHGSDPIPLDLLDTGLLRAHSLDDAAVLKKYADVLAAIRSKSDKERIQQRYERFLRARTKELAAGMHTWLLNMSSAALVDPELRPRPRLMNPSPADTLSAQKGIPVAVKDRLLRMHVRSDGGHWLLYRTPGRATKADKIRLAHDARTLRVGLGVPEVLPLVEQLDHLLKRRSSDSSEVQYTLPLRSQRTVAGLDVVGAFLAE